MDSSCQIYTNELLICLVVCILSFALIAYAFRNLNKLVLLSIIIPSAILCFFLFATVRVNDDEHISSYNYHTRYCSIRKYIP